MNTSSAPSHPRAVRFPIRRYTLVRNPVTFVIAFSEMEKQGFSPGTQTQLPHDVGTLMVEPGDPWAIAFQTSYGLPIPYLFAGYNWTKPATATIELFRPARYIRFKIWAGPGRFTAYKANGEVLFQENWQGEPLRNFERSSADAFTRLQFEKPSGTTHAIGDITLRT